MTSFDLHGRTALVTGGFSGLGLHFAQVLAQHGVRLALAGRRIELGRAVAAEIGAAVGRPDEVHAFALDVTDGASVRECLARDGLSGLFGEASWSGTNPSLTKCGMVRLSRQTWISAWPSANERPPARP